MMGLVSRCRICDIRKLCKMSRKVLQHIFLHCDGRTVEFSHFSNIVTLQCEHHFPLWR